MRSHTDRATELHEKEREIRGSASCAYWADNQSYRTTGSVQQEQESGPLTGEVERSDTGLSGPLADDTQQPLLNH